MVARALRADWWSPRSRPGFSLPSLFCPVHCHLHWVLGLVYIPSKKNLLAKLSSLSLSLSFSSATSLWGPFSVDHLDLSFLSKTKWILRNGGSLLWRIVEGVYPELTGAVSVIMKSVLWNVTRDWSTVAVGEISNNITEPINHAFGFFLWVCENRELGGKKTISHTYNTKKSTTCFTWTANKHGWHCNTWLLYFSLPNCHIVL